MKAEHMLQKMKRMEPHDKVARQFPEKLWTGTHAQQREIIFFGDFLRYAWRCDTKVLAKHNPTGVLLEWVEGDKYIIQEPNQEHITALLSYYKMEEITPAGEKLDERFDTKGEENE